mgnify:CR=1 FL=1
MDTGSGCAESQPFALRVLGDSMLPEFPEGAVIIIDPAGAVYDGCYVMAEVDNEYIMSPKDLKTIDFIDKILDAGVTVLKIEGRGRAPDYVKVVAQCYREAADAVLEGTYTKERLADWEEAVA